MTGVRHEVPTVRGEIKLPPPAGQPGGSLFRALQLRRTTREIGARTLSRQTLSDLLWSACGVNRPQGPFGLPGRTAATASDSQEIDVYVAMRRGVFLYDALGHRLLPVVAEDLRRAAIGRGQDGAGAEAPVRLIYVADVDRLIHTAGFPEPGLLDPEVRKSYYFVDAGMIAAHVYLFAAARGLAAWFHNCDRTVLATKLKLPPDQRVLFGQTVGVPRQGARNRPG